MGTDTLPKTLTLEHTEMEVDDTCDYSWYEQLESKREIDGTPAVAYLSSRGINLETAKKAGVRYIADLYSRPAVLFPLVNGDGQFIAAHARFLDSNSPKALTLGKRSLGLFVATNDALEADTIAICEAPLDALACAVAGCSAIAICGVGNGPTWLRNKLSWKNVVIAFDNDKAGNEAAASLATTLGTFGVRVTRYLPEINGGPDVKDCNDVLVYGSKELLAIGLRPPIQEIEPLPHRKEKAVPCSECNDQPARFPIPTPTLCGACWDLTDLVVTINWDMDEEDGAEAT
jgi:hypothetical protein